MDTNQSDRQMKEYRIDDFSERENDQVDKANSECKMVDNGRIEDKPDDKKSDSNILKSNVQIRSNNVQSISTESSDRSACESDSVKRKVITTDDVRDELFKRQNIRNEKDSTDRMERSNRNSLNEKEEDEDEDAATEREQRKSKINRHLHNQRAYFDQKNNLDSEVSDIQSENESGEVQLTFDEKMKKMINMFIESYVPFNLLHSSYFTNLLRNTYRIRKMPKLIQMENLFERMFEMATKYNRQTISGAHSYTLQFEFWKSTNRRYQFITLRASYIDIFVRRSPVLSCFKVFYDWSPDRYIDKLNFIFKKFDLKREKVFAVVTNLKAKNFLSAINMYFGCEKLLFCLIHQLNAKFNELFLNCDFEEDKIHYEQPLKEVENVPVNEKENESQNSNDELSDSTDNEDFFGSDDFTDDDEQKNAKDQLESNENVTNATGADNDDDFNDRLGAEESDQEDEEEVIIGDETLAYVKLIEEPKDILRSLNNQKLSEMGPIPRVIKSLIKTFAYISSKANLLDELNQKTADRNGCEFLVYFLLANKNWNYLHKFLLYFKMVKTDVIEFLSKHSDVPFNLSDNDLEILEDLFNLLACLVKRMNHLSLASNLSLGQSLYIVKSFINILNPIDVMTEEAKQFKQEIINFLGTRHGVFERDQLYGIACLVDPKCTNLDFKDDQTFKEALEILYENLCFRLDKNFNIALYRIRYPLRQEIGYYQRARPYKKSGWNVAQVQLNSPVLQNLFYDFFTVPAICFEVKQIDYDIRDSVIECLSQIRNDTLIKVMLLNSLDQEVIDKLINHCKFW